MLAALGVLLGAALGAALPGTRQEDRLMGPSSDRVTDALKAKGEGLKASVKHAVDDTSGQQAPGTARDAKGPISPQGWVFHLDLPVMAASLRSVREAGATACSTPERLAAIERQRGAGQIACFVAGQPRDRSADIVFAIPDPAQRNALQERFGFLRVGLHPAFEPWRQGVGRDHIDAYAIRPHSHAAARLRQRMASLAAA